MSETDFEGFTTCSTPSDTKKIRRSGRKVLFPCNLESSPLLQLTDGLQTLSTDTNKLPHFTLLEGSEVVQKEDALVEKKLSIDDGCSVSSLILSSTSSPTNPFFKDQSKLKKNLMKRFDSDPTNSRSEHPRCQLFGRQYSENKENMGALKAITEVSKGISPLKSPFSGTKRVAFTNETNLMMSHRSRKINSQCPNTPGDDTFLRQVSFDDGYFDQMLARSNSVDQCHTPISELPKNFDKLLFSPVIDNAGSRKVTKGVSLRTPTFSCSYSPQISPDFTNLKRAGSIKDSDDLQSIFQSPVSTHHNVFKLPGDVPRLNNSNKKKARGKFNSSRVLLRSESVSNDHNTSSSSDDSFIAEPLNAKRRKNNHGDVHNKKELKKSCSLAAMSIKSALKRDETCPNLIGDFSREYSLPLVNGRHQDLKCISITTMADLLLDRYKQRISDFVIVDCRYPYEFDGGHIKGAINLPSYDHLMKHFFTSPLHFQAASPCNKTLLGEDMSSASGSDDDKDSNTRESIRMEKLQERNKELRSIIIFHCEFSSERGPQMSKYLRKIDRGDNLYPKLKYPELYLLEGGYKAFFARHPDLCEPKGYVQMHHPNFQKELRFFKCKSSSSLTSKTVTKSLRS